MAGGGEVLADDFGEDPGCGPDADAGHRGQDLVKRVGLHEFLDLGAGSRRVAAQVRELRGQVRQDDRRRRRCRGRRRSARRGRRRSLGAAGRQPRGVLACSRVRDPWPARPCAGRAGVGQRGQQLEDGRVIQVRAQDPFQGGVDLGEQAADPVARSGGLAGQVVVEADEHGQLGDVRRRRRRAQGVRHGAGGVGDDVASRASVLASPGCRSAIRRIARPGR